MKSSYRVTCTESVLDSRLEHWARRHGYHSEEPGDEWRRYSKGRRVFALLNGYHVRIEVRLTIEHGDAITVGADVRAMQYQGTNRGTRIEVEQSDILRCFVSGCMEGVVDVAFNTQSEQAASLNGP